MKKTEYLLQALLDKAHEQSGWVVSAFAVIRENLDDYKKHPYNYRIIQTPSGFQFIRPDGELEIIEDAIANEPLFNFQDPITVGPRWGLNIDKEYETTVGRIFLNTLLLSDIFKHKIPFNPKGFTVSAIETLIAPKLKDVPKDGKRNNDDIYVDEYVRFVDRLQYVEALSDLCNWSATPKNIKAPEGIKEYRQKLIEEYGDRLSDPSVLVEFESKLVAYDSEYMKDDPSSGIFIAGKVKNIARKKMYLGVGVEASFRTSSEVKPVLTSLEEGWPTDPDGFSMFINGLRYGSYARGMETVNGGVTAKSLLRSLGNFTILQNDCGAHEGLTRTFTDKNYDQLIGRYVKQGNKWILITEEAAKQYVGKSAVMRSPMYCLSPKETFCKYCIGEKLALNPNGLSLAVTDVSSIILYSFMKLMHGKVLSSAHFDFQTGLT